MKQITGNEILIEKHRAFLCNKVMRFLDGIQLGRLAKSY